jgi:N-acetyl-gamma-glutamyl-phosphate reductase
MIDVGIAGVSGYSGVTALELLLKHPKARVTYASANNTQGKVTDIWPQLAGKTDLTCGPFDLKKAVSLCDLIFLAVPHTASMTLTPKSKMVRPRTYRQWQFRKSCLWLARTLS